LGSRKSSKGRDPRYGFRKIPNKKESEMYLISEEAIPASRNKKD